MAAMDPKTFVQHLRETYAETVSDRRFVYPEWFKEKGGRLREAYRQLACAYWASTEVHAKAQARFEWRFPAFRPTGKMKCWGLATNSP